MIKHPLFVFLILCMTTMIGIAGEKTELQWTTLDSALRQAKESDKRLLVDVYTDWCGWCKKMDRDVFGNERVSQYLKQQFVLVKLNAESQTAVKYNDKPYTEASLAEYFGITGYPTTIFLEPNGDLITVVPGYIESNTFIDVSKFIGEGFFKKMTWEEYQSKKKSQDKK